jgi:hypothetical protein
MCQPIIHLRLTPPDFVIVSHWRRSSQEYNDSWLGEISQTKSETLRFQTLRCKRSICMGKRLEGSVLFVCRQRAPVLFVLIGRVRRHGTRATGLLRHLSAESIA